MTSELRVLHIAPTPFFSDRGCHIRIEGILRALQKQQVSNRLCTYHHGRDRPDIDTVRIPAMTGYQDTTAGPKQDKYHADLKLLKLVCQQIRSYHPHIIHAYLHEGIAIGWAARWLTLNVQIPLVADIQGSLVGELDTYDYFRGAEHARWIFHRIEAGLVKLPHYTFCSSEASLATLRGPLNIPAERSELLHDTCNVPFPLTHPPLQIVDGEQCNILYSGSLLASKGLPVLLEVIKRLLSRRQDVRFTIVGYPTEATHKFLTDNSLMADCTLIGRVAVDQLPTFLTEAHIALDPKGEAGSEGSGKIINYMAAGLPIVAFDSPNNRSLLGVTQQLVPKGSVEGFVERIENLIDHPLSRQHEGEQNRQRAVHYFDQQQSTGPVLACYERLLNGSKVKRTGRRAWRRS